MKNLADACRATMVLILVSTLLLAWVAFVPRPDVLNIGFSLYQLAVTTEESLRPPKLSAFIDQIDQGVATGKKIPEAIAAIKVSDVLSLSDTPLARLFPPFDMDAEKKKLYREWLTKREDELAKIENKEAFGIRMQPFNASPLSAAGARFKKHVEGLQLLFSQSTKLSENATMEQLQDVVSPSIKVPFIDQTVAAELGIVLISVGLVGPFLYLISLCGTMRSAIPLAREIDGMDWVFFHSGPIGVFLGIVWLCTPAIITLAAWVKVGFRGYSAPIMFLLLLGLFVWALHAALATRGLLLTHQTTLLPARPSEPKGADTAERH